MTKKGENIIIFINESLYVRYSKSTWWIDLGVTVRVANSLQGCVIKIMSLSFRPYFEEENRKLVKNKILPPLEFSYLEQCIECIKGKYVN
jgi:hypothetical protein